MLQHAWYAGGQAGCRQLICWCLTSHQSTACTHSRLLPANTQQSSVVQSPSRAPSSFPADCLSPAAFNACPSTMSTTIHRRLTQWAATGEWCGPWSQMQLRNELERRPLNRLQPAGTTAHVKCLHVDNSVHGACIIQRMPTQLAVLESHAACPYHPPCGLQSDMLAVEV